MNVTHFYMYDHRCTFNWTTKGNQILHQHVLSLSSNWQLKPTSFSSPQFCLRPFEVESSCGTKPTVWIYIPKEIYYIGLCDMGSSSILGGHLVVWGFPVLCQSVLLTRLKSSTLIWRPPAQLQAKHSAFSLSIAQSSLSPSTGPILVSVTPPDRIFRPHHQPSRIKWIFSENFTSYRKMKMHN